MVLLSKAKNKKNNKREKSKMRGKISVKKIYIICPANNKTGGTELLHQLANELKHNNKDVYIAYYYEGKSDKMNPTPEDFKKYKTKICSESEIEDDNKNILILPEVCIGKYRKYKSIQKAIWWLSVDNYLFMRGKSNRLKKYGLLSFFKHLIYNDYFSDKDINRFDYHFYQSYYAEEFLKKHSIDKTKMFYLSDYINDIYIKDFDKNKKEDIVIYNPKKGWDFTAKLIERGKEIKWIPIQNMTNQEVRELMQRAKVYIDFGNHPGKDRIPREAAMSGCCVFTNKKGSAAYKLDVPILNKYKYDDMDENIDLILKEIKNCFENYLTCIEEFQDYREFISIEKNKFCEDVKSIFGDT